VRHIWLRPEPSSVSFDNRPVNRQAHAHPLRFHGIKAIENTLQIRWIQARPRITIKTKVDPGLVKASPSVSSFSDSSLIWAICYELTNSCRGPSATPLMAWERHSGRLVRRGQGSEFAGQRNIHGGCVYQGKNTSACPFNRGNRTVAPRHSPLAKSKATTSSWATQQRRPSGAKRRPRGLRNSTDPAGERPGPGVRRGHHIPEW